jgi:hypothetical protein
MSRAVAILSFGFDAALLHPSPASPIIANQFAAEPWGANVCRRAHCRPVAAVPAAWIGLVRRGRRGTSGTASPVLSAQATAQYPRRYDQILSASGIQAWSSRISATKGEGLPVAFLSVSLRTSIGSWCASITEAFSRALQAVARALRAAAPRPEREYRTRVRYGVRDLWPTMARRAVDHARRVVQCAQRTQ